MKFLNFFLLLWVIFALLNPDPDSDYGSRSTDLVESGSIRIRNTGKNVIKASPSAANQWGWQFKNGLGSLISYTFMIILYNNNFGPHLLQPHSYLYTGNFHQKSPVQYVLINKSWKIKLAAKHLFIWKPATVLRWTLKGQRHEIFDFWFFSWISFPQATVSLTLTPVASCHRYQRNGRQIMGTISGCWDLKVNLKAEMYL